MKEKNYRPYENMEEFKRYKKDICIINKKNRWRCRFLSYIYDWGVNHIFVGSDEEPIIDYELFSFEELFNQWEYEDGTPCGMELISD